MNPAPIEWTPPNPQVVKLYRDALDLYRATENLKDEPKPNQVEEVA